MMTRVTATGETFASELLNPDRWPWVTRPMFVSPRVEISADGLTALILDFAAKRGSITGFVTLDLDFSDGWAYESEGYPFGRSLIVDILDACGPTPYLVDLLGWFVLAGATIRSYDVYCDKAITMRIGRS